MTGATSLRLLHVIPSLSHVHGGPSRAIRSIENALAAVGVDVVVATTDDDGPTGRLVRQTGCLLVEEGRKRIYFRKFTDFYTFAPGLAVWLWRNVRSFDVCHVHALFSFPSTVASVIALLRGVPLIVRPLGTLNEYGIRQRRPLLKRISLALVERPILRRAVTVHCTSTDEQREVRNVEWAARTAVIPLAVESPAELNVEESVAMWPQYAGKKLVLFLSRLHPKKNVETLLDAWAELKPDVQTLLVIAGSGDAEYVQSLVDRALLLGIADRVSWAGYVEGRKKEALFGLATVFVLPSFAENFGIAVAEALSHGVPCIVAPQVALAGDVAASAAGSVVAPLPAELAISMSKYLHDDQFRSVQSQRARQLADREFSPAIMAGRLFDLYRSIPGRSAGHA